MPKVEFKLLPPAEAVCFFRGNGFAVPINQHAFLASPDARGVLASVLAVVEREADAA